jgi:glycosyltransferase involved in cell wall biosynthesis
VRLFRISEKKIEVVYLGKSRDFQPITDKSSIDNFREKNNLKRDFILYVGTLEPRKNITGLINAYRLFKDMTPYLNYALVIGGGKGWMYSDIFELIEKLSLMNDVIFLGYVQDKELPILYNAAKLFVYPSLYEGFGLPVLEAMACGVPVITSNTSSLPEIVADAGIMLDPLDINALAKAMHNVLMDDSLRHSLIEKGLKRAENFSWEKTAAMTMNIYRKVLSEGKG